MPPLAPQLAKRAAAQISKSRRIEELAHQDGCRRLLRERCDTVATLHKVSKALPLRLARSIIQILRNPATRGLRFFRFNDIIALSGKQERYVKIAQENNS